MAAHEDHILKALAKFETKLDSLDSRLDSVDKTLVKQEANLGEHMRRTDLAEKQIGNIQEEIRPIKRHVIMMEGALKGLGLLAVLVGLISGILKIISFAK